MADDGSAQSSVWPLPKFYFSVDMGGQKELKFQEVTGLESEKQVIEYRSGNKPAFSTIKMPGLNKVGNVTLKKGVFQKDNSFFDWYNQIKMNTMPTKITGTDLKSEGNEIAIESVEIAFETLTINVG